MTQPSPAYWAGFFDGDGYLGVTPIDGRHYVMLSIAQKTPAVLHLLQQYAGGGVNQYSNGYWCWNVTGEKAVNFLRSLHPHSKMKRPQMEIALAYHDDRSGVHGKIALSLIHI